MCARKKKDMFVVVAATNSGSSVISNPITLQDYVSDYESTGAMRGLYSSTHDSTLGIFPWAHLFCSGLASRSAPVWRNPSLRLYLCGEICAKPK